MIPQTLQIRNFLSYGDEPQTIDFRSYKLICLSGKNGHGKSALLDAITWALWGQARKISGSAKADEGLLRLGHDAMMVIFDFELHGHIYRVKREYINRYGKPLTSLEFAVRDTSTESYKPLTGKTIRETQALIEQTMKLSFDSFTNSAFLRQGQSNEFSKKSPRERKEILGSILGLTQFDTIRKRALEKMREESQERAALHAVQQILEKDLTTRQSIVEESAHIDQQIAALHRDHELLAQEKERLDVESADIAHHQQKRSLLAYQQTTVRDTHATVLETIRASVLEWRTIHAQKLDNNAASRLEADRIALVNDISKFQEHQQRLLTLKEQILLEKQTIQLIESAHAKHNHDAQQQLQLSCERLQSDLLNHTATLLDHDRQLKATSLILEQLKTQKKSLETVQKNATNFLAQLQIIEHQFLKRKSSYQKFIAHANWLTNQVKELEQKKQLVIDQHNPSCPLCEQNLSAARRRFLTEKFIDQQAFITHQIGRLSTVITNLKKLLVEQHAQVESLKTEKDSYLQRETIAHEVDRQITAHEATQQQQRETIQNLQKRQSETQQTLTTHTQQLHALQHQSHASLQQNELYQTAHQKITLLEKELHTIVYNKTAHEQAQIRLAQIEQQLASHQTFLSQVAFQTARSNEIHHRIVQAKQIQQERIKIEQSLAEYASLDTRIANHATAQQHYNQRLHALNSRIGELMQHKGRLEQKLQLITEQQDQYLKNKLLLGQIESSLYDYEQIAAATSKDGIQALLIEDAIPEIEQAANDLLARLTHNNAQIFIESLKDLKSGGTKETLDIKISDSAGIRPYELFSGGEAFRIDFALRIAISKLLARRAGTALQTLIIDEGFGSQDDEGLSNIMDAMYTIQDDFQKIIIVSHLPSMKNQFPVHFVVEKRPNGSRVTVLEQD